MNIYFKWKWKEPDAKEKKKREKEITEYLQDNINPCHSGPVSVYLGENPLSQLGRLDGIILCECGKELMKCRADNFAYKLDFTI